MQRLSRFFGPTLVTPLLILVLCVLATWWFLRLSQGNAIPIPPTANATDGGDGGRIDAVVASARLFGSRRPGVLSDNVRALGVVADATGRGSVIVSVDGQAPKVYRVGDTLDGRLVSAIRPEEIELEANGARQVFRLPPARTSAPGLTILGTAPVVAPYIPESRVQTPPQSGPQYPSPAPLAPIPYSQAYPPLTPNVQQPIMPGVNQRRPVDLPPPPAPALSQ